VSAPRVVVLDSAGGERSARLAEELGLLRLVPSPRAPGVERALHRRGFAPGLTAVPAAVRALSGWDFDVVHAFTPFDAVVGLRRTGVPCVFTCTEVLDRGNVADRRLRLWSLTQAIERTAAVLAADEDVRASLERWFAMDAPVLDPDAHLGFYSGLLS
jgi:hypothetical protein